RFIPLSETLHLQRNYGCWHDIVRIYGLRRITEFVHFQVKNILSIFDCEKFTLARKIKKAGFLQFFQ
ncbi:MAG: hypothetical protein PVH93_08490, partial [Nitrosopumilaceae archaeon]